MQQDRVVVPNLTLGVDRDAAAVDSRDRKAIFVHHFEVDLDRLVGHLRGFLDRLPLRGDAWQLAPPLALPSPKCKPE